MTGVAGTKLKRRRKKMIKNVRGLEKKPTHFLQFRQEVQDENI